MKWINILVVSALAVSSFSACSSSKVVSVEREDEWSDKVPVDGLSNLYQVDEFLYRSEQPNKKDMAALEQFGIKSVLNLRRIQDDEREAKNTSLNLNHVPIKTFKMSYDEVLASIRFIDSADKPVLVHCLHGSDRTGVVVATYRILKQGWTKEAAIKEFKEGGYGYHEKWFPNLIELLESLDVEKLRSDLSLSTQH
jgi:protein tyrosine/serine phosphatase